jgi:hypothetical protein
MKSTKRTFHPRSPRSHSRAGATKYERSTKPHETARKESCVRSSRTSTDHMGLLSPATSSFITFPLRTGGRSLSAFLDIKISLSNSANNSYAHPESFLSRKSLLPATGYVYIRRHLLSVWLHMFTGKASCNSGHPAMTVQASIRIT